MAASLLRGEDGFSSCMRRQSLDVYLIAMIPLMHYNLMSLELTPYSWTGLDFEVPNVWYCTALKHLWPHLTHTVAGLVSRSKKRYTQDGFDLDLSYIDCQPQFQGKLVAMSFPAEGKESAPIT